MDAPLLALTRRRGASPGSSPQAVAVENMRQLIQLRWLAVGGQLATVVAVRFALGVPLPTTEMLSVVALLAAANLAAALVVKRHRVTNAEFLLALMFDVGSLTAQLYLSGGASNRFIALYLVQVVLGAILLESRLIWVLALVTAGCFAFLTYRHRPLLLPRGLVYDPADLFALGSWLSFALVATLLVLFIARISRNLRARELYLAGMREQAAEEDHIVRMGLFASGAAHELGTPLASLSVILSDWQRMPKLARDPELLGELREMQAEVQRCKSIVTDILHSAGEPRSEAMESIDARAFIEELAEEWREVRGDVPLACRTDGIDRLAVLADPALRQAVWNLLDNAAEASPGQIHLAAAREGDMLAIAVRDGGPGFTEAMLAQFGRPYQSSKGAGHGVGLFLVTNVARRLGGRVEPVNLAEGGAEVLMLVPLAHARPAEAAT